MKLRGCSRKEVKITEFKNYRQSCDSLPGLGMERDPSADDMGDADEEVELLCGDEVDGDADIDELSSILRLAATGGCHAL